MEGLLALHPRHLLKKVAENFLRLLSLIVGAKSSRPKSEPQRKKALPEGELDAYAD